MNENNYDKPDAETKLYVRESVEEISHDFTKLLKEISEQHSTVHGEFYKRIGALERTSVTSKEMEQRVRPIEDENNRKSGAKAVWMFLAVIGGGIVSAIATTLLRGLIK